MLKNMFLVSNDSAQNWILLGIPVLIIAGFLMHYVYEWSENSLVVGIFTPVSESVWEHLKLTFYPMLIWWLVGYFILSKNNKFPTNTWVTTCAVAEVTCLLLIVSFYYTYTGAFGFESLILDIFSLFLGVIAAQFLALHVYNYANPNQFCTYISIAILALLVIAFTVFTFYPIHIPLFEDPSTGKYGI